MRDGCLLSIIPKLHKSENISVISILVLSAVASMLFVPVSAYEENVSFDGDSSFNLLNCSRIVWYIDPSTGHLSPPSLRSGPIQSGGASCVKKQIEGPAMIHFCWKADLDIPQAGMLVFMVDDEIILQCTSSDWSPVDYAVPSGSHWLRWEYRKLRSYPEYAGAGWIDDLKIVYPKGQMPEVLPETATCCDKLPSISGDIERVNRGLAGLETRVGQIDLKIGDLSSNQTVLDNRTRIIEDGSVQVDVSIGDIYSQIEYINITQSDLKELVGRLNLSGLDERLRQLDTKIGDVDKKIANLSLNQTPSCNLSWICENVVYISNNSENLEEDINKNRNKIILLGDGVYHTSGLNITTNDIYIRSLRKWGATLDAENADIGVVLDTVKNITFDSVAVINCSRGVHIENSTNCNIINNLITDFNETGILSRNNSQCTFMLNRLDASGVNISGFDISRNDNNNTFLFNEININKSDDKSSLYVVTSWAKDNYIAVSDDGVIKEDDIYCRVWDNEFVCRWKNDSIANLTDLSNNTWSFLDWDTALINNME